MGRKKKIEKEETTDIIDLEEFDLDSDDDAEEASELELEDFDEEATVELDLEADSKKAKKRSKKSSKKKPKKKAKAKTTKAKAAEDSPVEVPSDLTDDDLELAVDPPEQDVTMVAGAVQQSMESMAKQWATVKDTTDHVSKNFERVSGMLGELPVAYDRMLQEMAKQHQAKPPQGVKAALVASLVALVLSGISLLYSQSVRQTVLDKPVAAAVRALAPAASKNTSRTAEIAKRPKAASSDLSEFTESTASKKSPAASRKKRKAISKKRSSQRR